MLGVLARWIAPLIGRLSWLFRTRVGQWFGVILAWAGITYGTQSFVVGPSLDALETLAQNAGNGAGDFGAKAIQWLGVMNFDIACTMVIGVVGAAQALSATKLVWRKRAT
jgi:hypothetical protein